jgi:hypothetical protein
MGLLTTKKQSMHRNMVDVSYLSEEDQLLASLGLTDFAKNFQ